MKTLDKIKSGMLEKSVTFMEYIEDKLNFIDKIFSE